MKLVSQNDDMTKIPLVLTVFFSTLAMTQGQKLGSEGDLIRQMLFASQSIKEQAKHSQRDGSDSAFQRIADAAGLVEAGKKSEAVAKLKSVLQMESLETRVELWTWSGLRELGEKPDQKAGTEVLGAIVEFPMKDGYDTLAAYADGSARYLNFSGAAIIWDAPDAKIKGLCRAFIESTVPLGRQAKVRNDTSLPKSGSQVTLLTRSGNYVVREPPQSVVGAAAKLMLELMDRAKTKRK